MEIINGKQLIEDAHNYDVILYGMGINNSMNNGFAYDIALNFPEVRVAENETGYGDLRKYGTINKVMSDDGIVFCACYCYNVGLKNKNNCVYIDYDALAKCLEYICQHYKNKRVACPIIGQDAYDGNGDKKKILDIFESVFPNEYNITLYDFVQQDFRKERYKEAVALRKLYTEGEISRDEFKHRKKLNEWKRISGIFKVMPDEFEYNPRKKSKNKITIYKKNLVK